MSTLAFLLPFLVVYTLFVVYAERKLSAFMQDRLGPMEVGHYGLLQTVADLLKLLQKEDIIHYKADRALFKIAPVIIFLVVFGAFSVLPLSPEWPGSSISSGVFFLLAFISIDVIGIMMAGWSSNNKYSSLGTLRAAAQMISYEVPLTLSVLCVVIHTQTLDLQWISQEQGILASGPTSFLGMPSSPVSAWGGFLSWNIFQQPLLIAAWGIFFIASLAECNRAPFDLPEAESELVAGYQTEYSGFRWAIMMLSEYAMMLLVSFLGVVLFLGSWNTPLPNVGSIRLAEWTTGHTWGLFWLLSKTIAMVFIQIWVRWSFPRIRIDQLMTLGWKWLTPVSLILIVITGMLKLI